MKTERILATKFTMEDKKVAMVTHKDALGMHLQNEPLLSVRKKLKTKIMCLVKLVQACMRS